MTRANRARGLRTRTGFTLVEMLVVIAIGGLLMGMLLPALSRTRESARTTVCLSNQRQLAVGWLSYAFDWRDRAMPLAYWSTADVGGGPQVFWWGTHGSSTAPPDHEAGFIAPYLDSGLREGSVFECPSQAWGTYRPQGPSRSVTSTYGYNGYYLSPSKTPGWAYSISHRRWRQLGDVRQPGELVVFADALLPGFAGQMPGNTALLDPPMVFSRSGGGRWNANASPTTAFRHGQARTGTGAGSTAAVYADGHAGTVRAQPEWLTHPEQGVGSVGGESGMRSYVPDWRGWRAP